MYRKLLIANRGEIAVRILRTCHDLGILAVALYHATDRGSLHVRLADEAVELNLPVDFTNPKRIIEIAQQVGADAIHPGYGFLAEHANFIRMVETAGLVVVGPPVNVLEAVTDKIHALEIARSAGFPVVEFSPLNFSQTDGFGTTFPPTVPLQEMDQASFDIIHREANHLGYPVVLKPCQGGRGRGERLVRSPDRLEDSILRARTEARAVYGDDRLYMEKALQPVHQVNVQILGDHLGHLIHFGEREGSITYGNQKIFEESPAPCLNAQQRTRLWQAALELARLFGYQNAGTVEFLVDAEGRFFFTEMKARIQIEHPITELVSQVDLVREQLCLSAGEALHFRQDDIHLQGWAMECRISAEDPWNQFLPCPGHLNRVRLPDGPGIRVDTYVYCDCDIPPDYDPLIAKLSVWAGDRSACLARTSRALEEFKLIGVPTNLPVLQHILRDPRIISGNYSTDDAFRLIESSQNRNIDNSVHHLRDMAVAAAIIYLRRMHGGAGNSTMHPIVPEQLTTGWHRSSRNLPE